MLNPIAGEVEAILEALTVRLPAVAAHSRRVATYSVRLANQYGLAADTIEAIRIGSLLHDVGKMMVPANILTKPGRLTDREWRALQRHSEYGFEMVQHLGFDEAITDIILYHHERTDRSGYPEGLAAEVIPWPVRIVSVMDTFDALTSPRSYRDALSIDAARTLLARESVDRYCPWVVSGLLSLPKAMLEAVANGGPSDGRPDACPSPAVLKGATTPWVAGYVDEPAHLSGW